MLEVESLCQKYVFMLKIFYIIIFEVPLLQLWTVFLKISSKGNNRAHRTIPNIRKNSELPYIKWKYESLQFSVAFYEMTAQCRGRYIPFLLHGRRGGGWLLKRKKLIKDKGKKRNRDIRGKNVDKGKNVLKCQKERRERWKVKKTKEEHKEGKMKMWKNSVIHKKWKFEKKLTKFS